MTAEAAPRKNRPAGRPAQKILSKEGITLAALKLIAAGGYEALTMSGLARKLGVAPSALYNHVTSKHDVLVLVQDHVMSGVDVSGFGTVPWAEAVRRWAWSYRDVFSHHTPLIPVIAVLPVTGAPRTLAMYEELTAGFLAADWPQPLIVPAIVALESFIFGSAYDVTAPEDIFESGELADANPKFTAAVRARQRGEGGTGSRTADAAFRLGLEGLISGLETQRRSWPGDSA
ncbi:TetR/AcrR family transcriptional regulator [Arthrobacter sp. I2-34]|uniref:TetR/AcrR family transcriptional regulator n=1 Tax=Arthrobacter hankyongi TaxID=2904801 RepID=A0ABS9L2A2_9MICC|nr:TetR/AcrR family transcriptional regulator [Arthrobacter hankyongi]MCG2620703.1 TetR/AcrR family transcriptional regulator [Arthrobacter hankyongi]